MFRAKHTFETMLSRLMRYCASASVSIIPPSRPFVSHLGSFSSMTTSSNVNPVTPIPCSSHNMLVFKLMLSPSGVDCYSISDYNNILSSLHKTGHDLTIIELAQRCEKSKTYNNVFPNINTWKILISCHYSL